MICEIGRRCRKHLTCPDCARSWQRKEFKTFCEGTKIQPDGILTYFVIKTQRRGNLFYSVDELYKVVDDIREAVKRSRISSVFFGRLEVSFSQSMGFNPHLNLITFGDVTPFLEILMRYNLSVYRRIKENDKNVSRSIVWYMCKHNNLGYEKGEIVRTILNKRQTIVSSRHFKNLNIGDVSATDVDYSFLKPCPIRYREEVELRSNYASQRRRGREALISKIEAIKKLYETA